jgi:hypothetical protein
MSERETVEELATIDKWAFERAIPLLDAPQRRTPDLSEWARTTSDRVLLIANELALTAPEAYAENQLRISECLLDLNFIEAARPVVSLRLGREFGSKT